MLKFLVLSVVVLVLSLPSFSGTEQPENNRPTPELPGSIR